MRCPRAPRRTDRAARRAKYEPQPVDRDLVKAVLSVEANAERAPARACALTDRPQPKPRHRPDRRRFPPLSLRPSPAKSVRGRRRRSAQSGPRTPGRRRAPTLRTSSSSGGLTTAPSATSVTARSSCGSSGRLRPSSLALTDPPDALSSRSAGHVRILSHHLQARDDDVQNRVSVFTRSTRRASTRRSPTALGSESGDQAIHSARGRTEGRAARC